MSLGTAKLSAGPRAKPHTPENKQEPAAPPPMNVQYQQTTKRAIGV